MNVSDVPVLVIARYADNPGAYNGYIVPSVGSIYFIFTDDNPDGTLDHFENLTNKIRPLLNTGHLDKIFEEVIAQTLPMRLPAKLEKNTQVTEVLAIQVVNKTLFMNFGGG